MKYALFTVWFVDGRTNNPYAPGPLEACILAQARAITKGQDYQIASVQNQETGITYIFLAAGLRKLPND